MLLEPKFSGSSDNSDSDSSDEDIVPKVGGLVVLELFPVFVLGVRVEG